MFFNITELWLRVRHDSLIDCMGWLDNMADLVYIPEYVKQFDIYLGVQHLTISMILIIVILITLCSVDYVYIQLYLTLLRNAVYSTYWI